MLAVMVADPSEMTTEARDRWVAEIDSWDVCDTAADLFGAMPKAERTIRAWARRPEAYVKRCAFSMIARAAIREKTSPDARFERFFPLIRRGATDDRNEVKKAVNWALRQIGKRNPALHERAIEEAVEIARLDARSARWIAADALRELRNPATIARLSRD